MKPTNTTEQKKKGAQIFEGVVVSNKMKDTVVVEVSRFVKHPKYKKYLSRSKRFKAHNEGNTANIGDVVSIIACAPISKDKRFRVI